MKMEKLYSKDKISLLCDSITDSIENSSANNLDIDNLLTILKIICCGVPGEKAINFYFHILHPEECVSSLLKIKRFQAKLKETPIQSASIVKSILRLPQISHELAESLSNITSLVSFAKDERTILIREILSHTSIGNFPRPFIEELLEEDSELWEVKFVEFYNEETEDAEFKSTFDLWTNLSTNSPKIFQILSSIMNKFFCISKNKALVFSLINLFINETTKKCRINNVDFVSLYPYNLQSIVSLLCLNIKDFPPECSARIKNSVKEKLEILRSTCPNQVILLLTHFYYWNNVIQLQ